MKILNQRIRLKRLEKNMKQIDLAKKLGVSQSSIANWESGEREPALAIIIDLSKVFGCSVNYLLGLED